ncbi:SGNH/GDSL hydrolase family protein [Virgibacillus sp. LDC1]|nr:SGNH/GDSL hydrolase family protein [Virgibacillus sp. LDC1]
MASRYGGITGSKRISEDFQNINTAFENVQSEMDANKSVVDNHLSSTSAHKAENITYTGEATGTNVKQAIDGLDTRIDSIVAQSGDDNTEIVDARGGFPVLGERLNASDTQIAQVENDISEINNGLTDTLKKGDLFSSLYGMAVEESNVQPNGSLDKFVSAMKAGVVNIVFWGDSITEGLDNISPLDTYVSKFITTLKRRFPKVTINYANYSIAGATSSNAADPNYVAGTSFTRPWGVNGKSWRDHVRDYSPDLVVIAFGMNDAVSNNGDATIKTNYDSIVTYMNTWSKVPNVAFVTSIMSTLDTSIYSVTQANITAVNRSIREYARNGGYALADANRLSKILRDGVDDVSRIHTSETNWTGYNTTSWDGDKASFTLSGSTLTPAAGVTNKFVRRTRSIYNGFIEFDVVPVDVGAQGWIVIEYRKSDTGYIALVIHPGSSGSGIVAFYIDALSTPVSSKTNLTIVPGTSYKIRIEFYGTTHTVFINGVNTLSFNTHENMQDGSIRMGGINKLATFLNLNIGFCDSLKTPGQFTDEQLLGPYNDPASGNGVNHPSALGTSLIYVPSMIGIVQEASKHVQKSGLLLPTRLLKTEFAAPGTGYPTTTTAGEKLYFKTVNSYDKSLGIALRRIDNGAYYSLSTKAISDATLDQLEPGNFAYYKVNATLDFVWISVPSSGPVPSDMDLYRIM